MRILSQIEAQIKADVEKAKHEAEEERELRRAEAVIAHKLFEKEQAAKAAVTVSRKQARIERRLERSQLEFQQIKEELEEAERLRQKRIEDREAIVAAAKDKKSIPSASSADRQKLREDYIKAAALRADALEAAKAADQACRALGAARGDTPTSDNGKPTRSASTAEKSSSRVKNPSVPFTTLSTAERRLRHWVLESLQSACTARSTVDGVRGIVARATSIGLGDDCPELLDARVKEHELAVARASDIIMKNGGEHEYAKEQYERLVSQGYNRAAERARRKMEDLWQKKTEAEGSLQYHEAQLSAALRSRDLEQDERRSQGRPATMIEEDEQMLSQTAETNEETWRLRSKQSGHESDHAKNLAKSEASQKKREERAMRHVKSMAAKNLKEAADLQRKLDKMRAQNEGQQLAKRAEQARHLAARELAAERQRQLADEKRLRKVEDTQRIAARADAAKAAAAAAKAAAQERARLKEAMTMALRCDATPEVKQWARALLEYEAKRRRAAADAARQLADLFIARRDEIIMERKAAQTQQDSCDGESLPSLVLAAAFEAAACVKPVDASHLQKPEFASTNSLGQHHRVKSDRLSRPLTATSEDSSCSGCEEDSSSESVASTTSESEFTELHVAEDANLPDTKIVQPETREGTVGQRFDTINESCSRSFKDIAIEISKAVAKSVTAVHTNQSVEDSECSAKDATEGASDKTAMHETEATIETGQAIDESKTSKIVLHFFNSLDESLSLELEVPPKWRAKPVRKLLNVFVKNLAARKGKVVCIDSLSVTTLSGNLVPSDNSIQEALALTKGVMRIICDRQ